jgi:hypothetical protein
MANSERAGIKRYRISGGVAGLVGLGLCLLFAACRPPTPRDPGTVAPQSDEAIKQGVNIALAKNADFNTCRGSLDQVNTYLSRQPDGGQVPPLSAEERNRLRQRFGLNDDELAEVESRTFTRLDAHYLDLCLLLREVVRSLELKPPASLEQAKAAFGWVVRQVRLRAGEGDPVPPIVALRRGWGTAQERSLVFLTLLLQLRIPGCMLAYSNGESSRPPYRYWIPGALVNKQIYLFDTRLGLPLPGPKGEGIVTLAQVQSAEGGEIFRQLAPEPKHAYDVTPAQVKNLEVHVACSLSALAPRMRFLQTEFFEPNTVSLAADASILEQFEAAVRGQAAIRTWWPATRALRHFVPVEEGGDERGGHAGLGSRQARAEAELVPMHVVPPRIMALPGDLRNKVVVGMFSPPFRSLYLQPRGPRDLLLRGRFDEASRDLVPLWEDLHVPPLGEQEKANLDKQVEEWCRLAIHVNGELIKAEDAAGSRGARDEELQAAKTRMDEVWKTGQAPLTLLMRTATAEPLGSEVTYQLALCKHEQAERAQDRLLRSAGPAAVEAAETARAAWRDAAYWWAKYEDSHAVTAETALARLRLVRQLHNAAHPEQAGPRVEYLSRDLSTAVSARILHVRALDHLGERDRAVALLDGFVRELHSLEEHSEGLFSLLEQPDQRGSVLWLLAGASYRMKQLRPH